jgi:hypothetical protein
MKKSTSIFVLIYFAVFLSLLTILTGCKKDEDYYTNKLIGTWVSSDLTDTLEIVTTKDIYKTVYGLRDHFDYNCAKDSITIKYNGTLMILVFPTTHPYRITNNQLTIDFRPVCYGFRNQIITFNKK